MEPFCRPNPNTGDRSAHYHIKEVQGLARLGSAPKKIGCLDPHFFRNLPSFNVLIKFNKCNVVPNISGQCLLRLIRIVLPQNKITLV